MVKPASLSKVLDAPLVPMCISNIHIPGIIISMNLGKERDSKTYHRDIAFGNEHGVRILWVLHRDFICVVEYLA